MRIMVHALTRCSFGPFSQQSMTTLLSSASNFFRKELYVPLSPSGGGGVVDGVDESLSLPFASFLALERASRATASMRYSE